MALAKTNREVLDDFWNENQGDFSKYEAQQGVATIKQAVTYVQTKHI
jgi:hypothetical protein